MILITNEDIAEKGNKLISSGYKGKAIVAFVDMLGFSQEILTKWDDAEFNPLQRIMEIKGFMDLAKKGSIDHTFLDYDEKTILGKIKYPEVITISDSFVFVQTLDDDTDITFILSLLAVTGSIIELWRISKDKGFTIRGGVDFGELFYTPSEIIGPAFIDAYNLESKIAEVSRIVYSKKISKMIYDKYITLHPTLKDYLLRYFKNDIDNYIILNPLVPFGFSSDAMLNEALNDFNGMMNSINNHNARNKYVNIIDHLDKKNRELSEFEMFNK